MNLYGRRNRVGSWEDRVVLNRVFASPASEPCSERAAALDYHRRTLLQHYLYYNTYKYKEGREKWWNIYI